MTFRMSLKTQSSCAHIWNYDAVGLYDALFIVMHDSTGVPQECSATSKMLQDSSGLHQTCST
jgi:hypothetical protein